MEFCKQCLVLFLLVAHSAGARVLEGDISSNSRDALISKADAISANSTHQKNESVPLPLHMTALNSKTTPPVAAASASPGPGVVSTSHDAFVDKVEAITLNKISSSPGAGAGAGAGAGGDNTISLDKLPSGQSPGVGHFSTHGHVEKMKNGVKEEKVALNKLPSGPSPGSGNAHVQNRVGLGVAKSGPSPGVGHGFKNANTQKSRQTSVPLPLGSIKAKASNQAGSGSGSGEETIGCGGGGVGGGGVVWGQGQASMSGSGSIKLFDDAGPTSTMFAIAGAREWDG